MSSISSVEDLIKLAKNEGIELSVEELEQISGGTDPVNMSEKELNNLIAVYERSVIQCKDMISSGASTPGAEATMQAASQAVSELKKIRKSRFGV